MTSIVKAAPPKDQAAVVILADVSGSMAGARIARLGDELRRLWPEINARLLAFSFEARWVDGPAGLPRPMGNTDLEAALLLAASVWPSEVIVISDGLPDDQDAAIRAANQVPGIISVLFVGDDGDVEGAAFMRRLAAVGGGVMVHKDIAKHLAIGDDLRGMLALDKPIAL